MITKTKLPYALLLICSLLYLQPAFALHSVMLAVPEHPEEALNWCGAATGQMVMEGYPADACSVLQEDVWMSIQANKVESQWDTDPAGLKETLQTLCPPEGSWHVYSRTTAESLMYSVAYWMTRNDYPVAALMDTSSHNSYLAHEEHWITIRGIITDLDPTTNTTVQLEHVWFNDPAVDMGDPALVRFVSDETWYSEMFPVSKAGSSYIGKYVAVIEPPAVKGRAVIKAPVLYGKLITAAVAKVQAVRWIKELNLTQYDSYKMLQGARELEPMLVNAEYGGYYIIPFSTDKMGNRASAAVIVNAYTGEFEEVASFAPVNYLSEKEAIDKTLSQLGKDAATSSKLSTTLVYPKGERVVSRYFPIWKVTVDNQSYGVTRQGRFLNKLPTTEFFVASPGKKPVGLAYNNKQLWSLDRDSKTLNRFDPMSGAPLKSVSLDLKAPKALSYNGTDVWVADEADRKLVAIDPETGRQRVSFELPIPKDKGFDSVEGMAWDGEYLWLAYFAGFSSSLNKVDPKTGELVQSVFADCHPKGLESDGTHLWTLCYNGKYNPAVIDQRTIKATSHEMLKTRTFINKIEGKAPSGLAYDGQFLWYGDQEKNRVLRVFPATQNNK